MPSILITIFITGPNHGGEVDTIADQIKDAVEDARHEYGDLAATKIIAFTRDDDLTMNELKEG